MFNAWELIESEMQTNSIWLSLQFALQTHAITTELCVVREVHLSVTCMSGVVAITSWPAKYARRELAKRQ